MSLHRKHNGLSAIALLEKVDVAIFVRFYNGKVIPKSYLNSEKEFPYHRTRYSKNAEQFEWRA